MLLAVVLLVGAGCSATKGDNQSGEENTTPTAATQPAGAREMDDTPAGDSMKSGDAMEKPGEDGHTDSGEAMKDGSDKSMKSAAGSYEAYSEDKLSRAEDGTVVLAFLAEWCKSCRAVEKSINDQLDEIPAGLSILKLDYDKETALKKKYGVTTQHSFVKVDAEGNMIKKWSGGNTLESVVSQAS